jgi:hypothetical protein
MLLLDYWLLEIENCGFGVSSIGVIFIQSFVKIWHLVKKSKWGTHNMVISQTYALLPFTMEVTQKVQFLPHRQHTETAQLTRPRLTGY